MSDFGDFDGADALVVGAFGEPGRRVFLLQARLGARVLTVKIEKAQAATLADHLRETLADRAVADPAEAARALLADEAEPMWVVGTIGLGYDADADRLGLSLQEFQPEDRAGEEPSGARIWISGAQAAALMAAIDMLVESGRPPCPLCGYPLDPAGHVCPKSNGHRPPTL